MRLSGVAAQEVACKRMSWQDGVNGAFELIAGFAILSNCVTLYRDKQWRGVNIWATVFFASWGYWNLYYYPWLDQWLSFMGGLLITAANTTYIVLMIKYRNN